MRGWFLPPAELQCLLQVLRELSAKGCGCVLVVDQERRLLGTFTDGDLRRTLQQKEAQVIPMSRELIPFSKCCILSSESLSEVACEMQQSAQHWRVEVFLALLIASCR